jgi:hypothetical protein
MGAGTGFEVVELRNLANAARKKLVRDWLNFEKCNLGDTSMWNLTSPATR